MNFRIRIFNFCFIKLYTLMYKTTRIIHAPSCQKGCE